MITEICDEREFPLWIDGVLVMGPIPGEDALEVYIPGKGLGRITREGRFVRPDPRVYEDDYLSPSDRVGGYYVR